MEAWCSYLRRLRSGYHTHTHTHTHSQTTTRWAFNREDISTESTHSPLLLVVAVVPSRGLAPGVGMDPSHDNKLAATAAPAHHPPCTFISSSFDELTRHHETATCRVVSCHTSCCSSTVWFRGHTSNEANDDGNCPILKTARGNDPCCGR